VKEILMDFLKMRKKRTVSLSELEQLASGTLDYYNFACCVMQLEAEGIIEKVKSHTITNLFFFKYTTILELNWKIS
jgi:hypothetical protein